MMMISSSVMKMWPSRVCALTRQNYVIALVVLVETNQVKSNLRVLHLYPGDFDLEQASFLEAVICKMLSDRRQEHNPSDLRLNEVPPSAINHFS